MSLTYVPGYYHPDTCGRCEAKTTDLFVYPIGYASAYRERGQQCTIWYLCEKCARREVGAAWDEEENTSPLKERDSLRNALEWILTAIEDTSLSDAHTIENARSICERHLK